VRSDQASRPRIARSSTSSSWTAWRVPAETFTTSCTTCKRFPAALSPWVKPGATPLPTWALCIGLGLSRNLEPSPLHPHPHFFIGIPARRPILGRQVPCSRIGDPCSCCIPVSLVCELPGAAHVDRRFSLRVLRSAKASDRNPECVRLRTGDRSDQVRPTQNNATD
jgi:hypothetical protein